LLAIDPQLSVERVGRQIRDEPIGREEPIAEPRHERFAIPVGTHTVELLAHPPAGRVVIDLPLVREQDRRRGVLLVRGAPRSPAQSTPRGGAPEPHRRRAWPHGPRRGTRAGACTYDDRPSRPGSSMPDSCTYKRCRGATACTYSTNP